MVKETLRPEDDVEVPIVEVHAFAFQDVLSEDWHDDPEKAMTS